MERIDISVYIIGESAVICEIGNRSIGSLAEGEFRKMESEHKFSTDPNQVDGNANPSLPFVVLGPANAKNKPLSPEWP